jgi:hypothetical protein
MLVIEWFQRRRTTTSPMVVQSRSSLVAAMLPPLGTLGYMLYLQLAFGDSLAFLHASAAWARIPRSPLENLAELLVQPGQGWASALADGGLPLDNWLDLTFVLFFIAMGVILLGQKRWSEAAFILLGSFIPFSSGLLMSQRRYMWVLFPVFVLLARWGKNTWVDRIILIAFLLALGLFTAMFANWYWVA